MGGDAEQRWLRHSYGRTQCFACSRQSQTCQHQAAPLEPRGGAGARWARGQTGAACAPARMRRRIGSQEAGLLACWARGPAGQPAAPPPSSHSTNPPSLHPAIPPPSYTQPGQHSSPHAQGQHSSPLPAGPAQQHTHTGRRQGAHPKGRALGAAAHGELVAVELAHHHGASRPQPCRDGGVVGRHVVGQHSAACRGAQAGGADVVLRRGQGGGGSCDGGGGVELGEARRGVRAAAPGLAPAWQAQARPQQRSLPARLPLCLSWSAGPPQLQGHRARELLRPGGQSEAGRARALPPSPPPLMPMATPARGPSATPAATCSSTARACGAWRGGWCGRQAGWAVWAAAGGVVCQGCRGRWRGCRWPRC
jgi:hypothetical protein